MRTDGTLQALQAGLSLARRAALAAPVPLTVSTAGWTAVIVAGRAALPPQAAAALGWTGLALALLMTPPKLGALHRLAAGAEARDPPGAGGLQWTAVEARLAATATALVGGGALLLAAAGVTGAAASVLTSQVVGHFGAESLPPPGLDALLLTLGMAAAPAVCVIGRFCVTLAADAAEPDARFARGWLLTRGGSVAAGAVWLLTCAAPLATLLTALGALDRLRAQGGVPLWEAAAVGFGFAAATQFLFSPLNAGALSQLRRAGLAREAAAAAVDTAASLGDKALRPRSAGAPPELLPT